MSAKQMSEDQDEDGLIASSFTTDVEDEGEDSESEASVDDGGPVFGAGDPSSSSSTDVDSASLNDLAEHVESIEYPHPEPYNNTHLTCELADVPELVDPYTVTMTLVSGATVEVRLHPGHPDEAVKVIYHSASGQFVKQDTHPMVDGVAGSAEQVFGELLEKLDSGSFPGDVVESLR